MKQPVKRVLEISFSPVGHAVTMPVLPTATFHHMSHAHIPGRIRGHIAHEKTGRGTELAPRPVCQTSQILITDQSISTLTW